MPRVVPPVDPASPRPEDEALAVLLAPERHEYDLSEFPEVAELMARVERMTPEIVPPASLEASPLPPPATMLAPLLARPTPSPQ